MTVFESIKEMNIDELTKFLNEFEALECTPWLEWWCSNYCDKCEPVIAYNQDFEKDVDYAWCELNKKCKFFQEMDESPDVKQIIRMWLETER